MRLICHTLSLCGLACLSSALRRHPGVAQPARDGALEAWAHHRNDTQHRRLSSMSRKPTAEASSPAEHRVASLPGLAAKDAPTSWAGYITVSPSERSRLFYWLFEHRPGGSGAAPTQNNAGADTPLVVWLNGGPGCSSMDGLFIENGPLKVLPGSQGLKTHPHGWDRVGHLLYLEQPVGTGLSYTGRGAYRANDKEVNEHLYTFFQKTIRLHADKLVSKGDAKRSVPIYLSGESHAGHYLPSFVAHVLARTKKGVAGGEVVLDVRGAAIGNGWIDPYHQYGVTAMAHGLGLIDSSQAASLDGVEKECQRKLSQKKFLSSVCWDLLDTVIASSGVKGSRKTLQYDAREFVRSSAEFPHGHADVERYMNRRDVREALHAAECPHTFKECMDPPYNALKHQDGLGVVGDIEKALDGGVKMLFFNGQFDIICSHMGIERSLAALDFKGSKQYRGATRGVWQSPGATKPSGYVRSAGGLTNVLVLDSGHMVPLDQPEAALDLMQRFVSGASLSDGNQKVGGAKGTLAVPADGRGPEADPDAHAVRCDEAALRRGDGHADPEAATEGAAQPPRVLEDDGCGGEAAASGAICDVTLAFGMTLPVGAELTLVGEDGGAAGAAFDSLIVADVARALSVESDRVSVVARSASEATVKVDDVAGGVDLAAMWRSGALASGVVMGGYANLGGAAMRITRTVRTAMGSGAAAGGLRGDGAAGAGAGESVALLPEEGDGSVNVGTLAAGCGVLGLALVFWARGRRPPGKGAL